MYEQESNRELLAKRSRTCRGNVPEALSTCTTCARLGNGLATSEFAITRRFPTIGEQTSRCSRGRRRRYRPNVLSQDREHSASAQPPLNGLAAIQRTVLEVQDAWRDLKRPRTATKMRQAAFARLLAASDAPHQSTRAAQSRVVMLVQLSVVCVLLERSSPDVADGLAVWSSLKKC